MKAKKCNTFTSISCRNNCFTQAAIFVWEQYEEKEHKVHHAHRSISGALLVLVRILLAAIFAFNLYTMVSKERSALKRNFYVHFTKVYFHLFQVQLFSDIVQQVQVVQYSGYTFTLKNSLINVIQYHGT